MGIKSDEDRMTWLEEFDITIGEMLRRLNDYRAPDANYDSEMESAIKTACGTLSTMTKTRLDALYADVMRAQRKK